jgi:hypothetical protein
MDPLLIIGTGALLYYLVRKNGNLKFKIKDNTHKAIAQSYVNELLIKIEPYGKKILYSEIGETDDEINTCYKLQDTVSREMKKYLSENLSDCGFSRMKIHDLKNEILSIIDDRFKDSNHSWDLFGITNKTFKMLIENYDSREKNW